MAAVTATASNPAQCAGCVMTMTSGPAANQSTRIVRYDSANGVFDVLPFAGQTLNASNNVLVNGVALTGSYFVNGVPFSGTGFGFTAPGTEQKDSVSGMAGTYNVALLPNDAMNRTLSVSANSDYTAADFQHMLLAAQPPNAAGTGITTLPSFHRPSLTTWWINQAAPMSASIDVSNLTAVVSSFTATSPLNLTLPIGTTYVSGGVSTVVNVSTSQPVPLPPSTLVVPASTPTTVTGTASVTLTLPVGTIYTQPATATLPAQPSPSLRARLRRPPPSREHISYRRPLRRSVFLPTHRSPCRRREPQRRGADGTRRRGRLR